MRIGIDIDDTICTTSDLINQVVVEHNLNLTSDFDSYDDRVLITYDDLIRENIDNIMKNCPLKKDAKEVINYFRKKHHKIYIITARNNYYSDNICNITINYLKKHGIIYDKIIFDCSNKEIYCSENKIDVMLDDNLSLMKRLENVKTKGVLFITSYNKNYDGCKVSSWMEFKKIIDDWR